MVARFRTKNAKNWHLLVVFMKISSLSGFWFEGGEAKRVSGFAPAPTKPGSISKTNSHGRQAFTLVEVLAATAIAAIILTALFAGISTGISVLKTTRENLRATQIMVSRMEGLRLCAWGTNQLFNPVVVPATFTDYFYPVGLGYQTNGAVYSGTMTVTTNFTLNPAASYNGQMALVTVRVSWNDAFYGVTTTHTRSVSTLVAQNGIQNYVYNY